MAKRSILTPEVLRQLLRYDPKTGKLFWRKRDQRWFTGKGRKSPSHRMNIWNSKFAGKEAFTAQIYGGYHIGSIFGLSMNAHRVAYSMVHGIHVVELREIDHVNGVQSDNRISNLREVSHQDNTRNAKLYKTNRSGCPGVMWEESHKAWSVKINIDGKQKRITREKCFGRAVMRRKSEERKHGYHKNHGRAA